MKIGVVGLGYVGLVTAAVLAKHDNEVIGIDISAERVNKLNSNNLPIFEPELGNRIESAGSRLKFSTDYSDLAECSGVFVCVPTPNNEAGIDLSFVVAASKEVSKVVPKSELIIKSTVTPGTARHISNLTGMNVTSNPEFTREGSAVYDTEHPDRIVVGGNDPQVCKDVWKFTNAPTIITTNENAELIKYASNAFLATKITFINQMADLCEKIPGADVKIVAHGIGLDHRIGKEFLKPGLGYGGSCFPKDTIALNSYANSKDVKLDIIDSVIRYNSDRINQLVEKIIRLAGDLNDRNICVLGLSFKDNTDDLRESRSIALIENLSKRGAKIFAYDPIVKQYPGIVQCNSSEECIMKCSIVITATEWEEFRSIDPVLFKDKMVFDLRRILSIKPDDITMGVGIGKD
jgi:UDPglucose 6-dehydrogenase